MAGSGAGAGQAAAVWHVRPGSVLRMRVRVGGARGDELLCSVRGEERGGERGKERRKEKGKWEKEKEKEKERRERKNEREVERFAPRSRRLPATRNVACARGRGHREAVGGWESDTWNREIFRGKRVRGLGEF